MKIIHTSDLHLASPLSSRLNAAQGNRRRRELRECFLRMVEAAEASGVGAIIIAGDLFDSERIVKREIDAFISTVEHAGAIQFFYLPGNHEGELLRDNTYTLPCNLHIFDKEWTYYRLGDVCLCGRSTTEPMMFESLKLSGDEKNIVVLHGELREHSESGDIIGAKELPRRNIDYLALGHYHSYQAFEFEPGHIAVYSGAPEGRGFDECGDMGYVLIDTEEKITHKFIPFAKRRILEIEVDISGAIRTFDIEEKIKDAIKNQNPDDIIRVVLTGHREPTLKYDAGYLCDSFRSRHFHFDIKDKSRLSIRSEDYRYDKSLKGEFIRLCLEGGDDEMTMKIIECGLCALAGESTEG